MKLLSAVAALVLATILLAVPAFAADTIIGGAVDSVTGWIADLIIGGIFALVLWAVTIFKAKTGIDIQKTVTDFEANHRDALHSAIQSAVGALITKYGADALGKLPFGSAISSELVSLVNGSVPDAVKALGATPSAIVTIAQSKLSAHPAVVANSLPPPSLAAPA